MIPIVVFPSILQEDDEDVASIHINEFDGVTFDDTSTGGIGKRVVTIDSGQQAYKINAGTINAGSSVSLHLENTNADYLTSGTAKVILIIRGSSTTLTDFEIIEDSSADAGTGTTKEDFPSVSISTSSFITSKELSFAASRYITVKANTGNIVSVMGYVIE